MRRDARNHRAQVAELARRTFGPEAPNQ
jgi:hypothetical protein